MPRLVQWSRFSDAFQKLFGLQGATQLNVIDDVFLTLPAEEELEHLAVLRGWRSFGWGGNLGAAVGQVSSLSISVLAGYMAVIEGWTAYAAAAGSARCGLALTGVLGTPTVPARDNRAATVAGPPPRLSGVAFIGRTSAVALVGNPTLDIAMPTPLVKVPHVISGGIDFIVENQTPNQAFNVSVWGKYRELTDQER